MDDVRWEPDDYSGGLEADVGAASLTVCGDDEAPDTHTDIVVSWAGDYMVERVAGGVADAKRRAIEVAREILTESVAQLDALGASEPPPEHHPDVCPRGEHHRPGVVCGECGLLCPVAEPATTCKFPHEPERVCADCVCKGCMSVPCSCAHPS